MKAVKFLIKAVVAVIALLVVAVLALPLWFGPVVKGVANAVAPGVVKTDFNLGRLALNPYSGRFELGDLQLSNPAGYSEKYAVTLGELVFACEPLSLMTDVIHIKEIRVKDVFASVVSKDGVGNFRQIQYNVAGGREKYEAAQLEKESVPSEETASPSASGTAETSEAPAKKVIVDHLEISGVRVQLGFLPLAVPMTIKLDDIGRKNGGATLQEIWDQILAAVLQAAGATGDQLKAFGGLVGDTGKQATESIGTAAKSAGEAVKAVGKDAKKALDSLKSLW